MLISGKERAVLLDTGFDEGELPEIVTSLTDLPIMLIHSHAHIDHTTGDKFWREAWIHPADAEELRQQPWGDDLLLHELEDSTEIDLGERILEVIHVPGHTPGSIALLDRSNRLLFSGDTIMSGTVPINKYPQSVSDFSNSMDKIYLRRNEFDLIYPSHRDWPLTHMDLENLRACAHKAYDADEKMDIFFSSIITSERVEVNLKRKGYKKGRCSVTLEILGT